MTKINTVLSDKIAKKLGDKVVMKACYRNALRALSHKDMPEGAVYVEGGAICEFQGKTMLIEHGWCVDSSDGSVIDVTFAAYPTKVIEYIPWMVISREDLVSGGIIKANGAPVSPKIIEVAIHDEFYKALYGQEANRQRRAVMNAKQQIVTDFWANRPSE